MKKILTILALALLWCTGLSAQKVSNVRAVQEGNNIVITYDIDSPAPEILLSVSTDGGLTFSSPLKKVSGDLSNVQSGTRFIVWDVLSERESLQGDKIVFSVVPASSSDNLGHGWVDLGLSVKWASCNVGADKPEAYGNHFSWGETAVKKSRYWWTSLKHFCTKGDLKLDSKSREYKNLRFSKYVLDKKYGVVDGRKVLESCDDAASFLWEGSWHIPTEAQWAELRENCTWTWTVVNNVNGYKVTSNVPGYTGRSIFLPACGWPSFDGRRIDEVGYYGRYWSSNIYPFDSKKACCVIFCYDYVRGSNLDRYYGMSIRPVTE